MATVGFKRLRANNFHRHEHIPTSRAAVSHKQYTWTGQPTTPPPPVSLKRPKTAYLNIIKDSNDFSECYCCAYSKLLQANSYAIHRLYGVTIVTENYIQFISSRLHVRNNTDLVDSQIIETVKLTPTITPRATCRAQHEQLLVRREQKSDCRVSRPFS